MMLKGKNVLITGGSKGIGKAVVLSMAEEGANICFTYRKHEREAIDIKEILEYKGIRVECVKCDVSNFLESKLVVKKVIDDFGSIDILINNAGINWDGVSWKISEEQWDRVIAVNLKGCFNFTRHAAVYFKRQNYGKIVNVTSINGLRGKFGQSNYSASKAGIIGFTKAVAKELGMYNVNVNAVAPGLIETPMLKNSNVKEKIINMAISEMALNNIGTSDDLANLIIFLVSSKAKHITGEVIKIDGGQYI